MLLELLCSPDIVGVITSCDACRERVGEVKCGQFWQEDLKKRTT